MTRLLTAIKGHFAAKPETAHECWDRLLREARSASERAEIDAVFSRELGELA